MILVAVLLVWWLKCYTKLDSLLVWQGGKEYLLNYWRLTKKKHYLPKVLTPLESLLPVLLLAALVMIVLGFFRSGLIKLVLSAALLMFILEVYRDQQELDAATSWHAQGKKDAISDLIKNCDFGPKDKLFTRLLMVRFRQWAVPLFWICVLDIWGGIIVWWLRQDLILSQQEKGKEFSSYQQNLTKWLYYLEFVPLRLWALGYALVGDFIPAFDYLMSHFKTLDHAEGLLEQSACLAININAKSLVTNQKNLDAKGISQLQKAAELHQRTVGLSLGLAVLVGIIVMVTG